MGKKKDVARMAREAAAATEAATVRSRIPGRFRRNFFNSHQAPRIQLRLHRAIYNGRLEKVRFLISIQRNPFTLTDSRQSALFLALARDQPVIAGDLLDLLAGPLISLRMYFDDNPQPHRDAQFWMRQPLLVAYGRDQIEFVYHQSAGMRVQPGEVVPAVEPGLLILCMFGSNSCGEVVWLRPRTRDDGRRVARIVSRIYEEGGDITLARGEWKGMNVFDVADEMNAIDVWWRMYELFGRTVLGVYRVVIMLWKMAERKAEAANRVRTFQELMQKADIDLVAELRKDRQMHRDLLQQGAHLGEFTVLQYLLEQVTEVECANSEMGRDDMRQHLVQLFISYTLHNKRNKQLPVQCLLFKPDLCGTVAKFEQTTLHWYIEEKPFDDRVGEHIVVYEYGRTRTGGMVGDLLRALVRNNWIDTAEQIHRMAMADGFDVFEDRSKTLAALRHCLDKEFDEMAAFLLVEIEQTITASERLDLLQHLFVRRELNSLSTELRALLLTPGIAVDRFAIGRLMGDALKSGRSNTFRELFYELWTVDATQIIRDIRDEDGNNLLGASIFDRKQLPLDLLKPPETTEIANEALEVSDSDDDVVEQARKFIWNQQRAVQPSQPIIDADALYDHAADFEQVYDELIASDCDVQHVNHNGENLLHIAVRNDNISVVKRLLRKDKVSPHTRTNSGETTMHFVCSAAVFDLLPCSDLTATDKDGLTPLLRYIQRSAPFTDPSLVDRMLESGASVTATDGHGRTALHLLLSAPNAQQAYRELDANFVDRTLVTATAGSTVRLSRATVRLLLRHATPLNAVDNDGNTPLLISHSDPSVFTQLCKSPDVDLLHVNNAGKTLLNKLFEFSDSTIDELLPVFRGQHRAQFDELFVRHAHEMAVERAISSPYQYNEYCRQRCGQITGRGFWRRCEAAVRGRIGQLALESYALEMTDTREAVRIVAQLIMAGANYWSPTEGASEEMRDWSSPLAGTMFECLLAIRD